MLDFVNPVFPSGGSPGSGIQRPIASAVSPDSAESKAFTSRVTLPCVPHLKALPSSRCFHEIPPSVVLRIAAAKPFSSATKPTGVPTPRGKTASVDLTPTHAEIASGTSTRRKSVTRELNRLGHPQAAEPGAVDQGAGALGGARSRRGRRRQRATFNNSRVSACPSHSISSR